tara:strand:- start:7701 stop:9485 length:1785 start_codon:yes stop_codon:yes gene_type:complete
MTEEKYNILFHTQEGQEEFYEQMETDGKTDDSKKVPERNVQVIDRKEDRKQTYYYLTHEEADTLRRDSRIKSIEWIEDPDIRWEVNASFTGSIDFARTCSETNLNNEVDWAKLRCVVDDWPNGTPANASASGLNLPRGTYDTGPYDGENVNVIVVDGHIDPDHPEMAVNRDGSGGSRVKQVNWFADSQYFSGTYSYGSYTHSDDNHGCHVAGTIAGNTQGWAPKAKIFNVNPLGGSNPNWIYFAYPLTLIYDSVTNRNSSGAWQTLAGTDPCVVNNSWSSYFAYSFPRNIYLAASGTVVTITDTASAAAVGLDTIWDNDQWKVKVPNDSAAMADDVNDLINLGMTVCCSMGNDNVPVISTARKDATYDPLNYWENYDVSLNGVYSTIDRSYYARGAGLNHRSNCISVGSTWFETHNGLFYDDIKAYYSSKGSRCDIWAPGTCILSSVHTGAQADARGSGYALDRYNGTSMSTPQVTGMAARIKSRYPHYTHWDVKQYLIETCQRMTVGADPAGLPEETRNLFYADDFFLRHKPIRARTGISWPKSTVNYRKYGAKSNYTITQTSVTGRPSRNGGNYHLGIKYPRTINRKLHLGA